MRVLVTNAGSSSLKLSLLDHDDTVLTHESIDVRAGDWNAESVAIRLRNLPAVPDVIGHRVVHGGRRYTEPVRIDDEVMRHLHELTDLAPLHQPKSLAGIGAVREVLPRVPEVACFDTAFHADLPAAAATYAVPADWNERYGLRRYGFHGLSHAYATRRASQLVAREPADLRLVVCHLGSGASLAAVAGGRPVDTTMGFTPLDGIVMATRSGAVDPGMLLWLGQHAGIPVDEIADALEHRSGLLGLCGSADVQEVTARAVEGDATAILALNAYLRSLRAGIAAMTATMGGLDVLVFTGGVGENSAEVRAGAARNLGFLGVALDTHRNESADGDVDVSTADAPVRTVVVTAREDLEIAAGARQLLA